MRVFILPWSLPLCTKTYLYISYIHELSSCRITAFPNIFIPPLAVLDFMPYFWYRARDETSGNLLHRRKTDNHPCSAGHNNFQSDMLYLTTGYTSHWNWVNVNHYVISPQHGLRSHYSFPIWVRPTLTCPLSRHPRTSEQLLFKNEYPQAFSLQKTKAMLAKVAC